jgi:hypothetical protein
VPGLGFRVPDLGFRVPDLGFRGRHLQQNLLQVKGAKSGKLYMICIYYF